MSDLISIHCFVSGKVQGVWFRASTKEQADKCGVAGWVRNLPDGRVEVLAAGERSQVARLYDWLHVGPPLAKVTSLTYEELPWQAFTGFTQK